MKRETENSFKERCRFSASLRYELFYSLNVLLDPQARIHASWRHATRDALGPDFHRGVRELGGAWEIWPVFGSLLPASRQAPTFEEIVAGLRALPPAVFREKILRGLIHAEEALRPLLAGSVALKAALDERVRRIARPQHAAPGVCRHRHQNRGRCGKRSAPTCTCSRPCSAQRRSVGNTLPGLNRTSGSNACFTRCWISRSTGSN